MKTMKLLIMAILVSTGICQGDELESRQVPTTPTSVPQVCNYIPVSPPPVGLTCDKTGTIVPGSKGVKYHTADFDTCVLTCQKKASCAAFGFNSLSQTCTLFTKSLTAMKFKRVPTGLNLFSSRGCYTKVCQNVSTIPKLSACTIDSGNDTLNEYPFTLRVANNTLAPFAGYYLSNQYDYLGGAIVGLFSTTTKGLFQLVNTTSKAPSAFGPGALEDYPHGATHLVAGGFPKGVAGRPVNSISFSYVYAPSADALTCSRSNGMLTCTNKYKKPMKFYVCDLVLQPLQAAIAVPKGCHELQFQYIPTCPTA